MFDFPDTPLDPNCTLELVDHFTRQMRLVPFKAIGAYFHEVRQHRSAPISGRLKPCMTQQDLADRINKQLCVGGHRITAGIIDRIERGTNVYGGYWERIWQILQGLQIRVQLIHAGTGAVDLFGPPDPNPQPAPAPTPRSPRPPRPTTAARPVPSNVAHATHHLRLTLQASLRASRLT